jgi:hypothetical protein
VVHELRVRGDKVEQSSLRDDVDELASGVDDGDATSARVLASRQHHSHIEQRCVEADFHKWSSTCQVRQRNTVGNDELIVRVLEQFVDVFWWVLLLVRLRERCIKIA